MTINSTIAASGPFIGTGVSQALPFDFSAASADEIRVEVDGVEITDFRVALESDGSGSVVGVFAVGGVIYIESAPAFTQETDFNRFAPYFPDAINTPLDRAAIRDIWLRDMVFRAPMLPRDGALLSGKFPTIDDTGRWTYVDGVPGIAGPAAAFRASLAALKAAPTGDGVSQYDGSTWYWTAGNFVSTPAAQIDVNVVQANGISLAAGAWQRQISDTVLLRTYGADPTGVIGAASAFERALAAGKRVVGSPGDVYLIERTVFVPQGREVIGNGATIIVGSGIIGALRMQSNNCKISGWVFQGTSAGAGFAVLDEGDSNEFSDNICRGDIGHYYFGTGARNVKLTGNVFAGLTAPENVAAAIAVEACQRVLVANNRFEDVPTGWGFHARGHPDGRLTESVLVTGNQFLQTKYSATKTATSGQTVFAFSLGSNVLIDIIKDEPKVRIQINGLPIAPIRPDGTTLYTIQHTGNDYTITFMSPRTAGEVVTLLGYRGAEQIQINTGVKNCVVTGNIVDGTADTGIIVLSPYCVVTNNHVRNTGYTGIAVYGDVDYVVVCNNIVANTSQMDDGFSSPDDYRVPSVFAGGIFAGGVNAVYSGNLIINDTGSMRYGFFTNKIAVPRTDGSAAVTFHDNTFVGSFTDGRYFMPNQTFGQRVNSIDVDGPLVFYPAQIDLEAAWVAGGGGQQPPDTNYWTVSGSAGIRAVRNTAITRDGGVSIQTVAGEYLEFSATRIGVFRDCVITVQFWARNAGGGSYVHVTTSLGGPESAIVVDILEQEWELRTVRVSLTADLNDVLRIRVGGNVGSANIQNIQIFGNRL